ncbi:unnamed protein product, partial [Tetraodon nigroviridis]
SDSPTTLTKDVTTHTRAMKLRHQDLKDKLEICILELKKLCIREAELTGRLSDDYPLLPGEKPPQIRRRIGAAFKLDDQSIPQGTKDSELSSVDGQLALQTKIFEAARKLCEEERLSKAVKKSRQLQCKREEKKLKRLQELAFQLRLERGRSSPHPALNASQGESFTSTPWGCLQGDFYFSSVVVSFLNEMCCVPLTLCKRGCFDFQIWVHPMTALCLILWCKMRVRSNSRSPFLLQFVAMRSTTSLLESIWGLINKYRMNSFKFDTVDGLSACSRHLFFSPLEAISQLSQLSCTEQAHSSSLSFTNGSYLSPSVTPQPLPLTPTSSPIPSINSVTSLVSSPADDLPPIQHSPWTESSLDQPYEKSKKSRSSSK